MRRLKKLLWCIFLFLALVSPFSTPLSAATLKQKTIVNQVNLDPAFSVFVSAKVGGYIFDIEGLTSPWATVEFSSTQGNVNLTTVANDQGVFHFTNALMPPTTGDFCFTSIDTAHIASPPLCFAPPPASTRTQIKGIILPPSLTIDKDVFKQGEMVTAQGKTAPDSEIKVFLFEDENPSLIELLDAFIPQVFAREGPALTITSNAQGDFDFNLPSFKSTAWRLFVGTQKTQFGQNPSPKSNILSFASLSWWLWLVLTVLAYSIKFLNLFINFLFQPTIIILILLSAIGIIIYLLKTGRK